jgi:hypothetical protein
MIVKASLIVMLVLAAALGSVAVLRQSATAPSVVSLTISGEDGPAVHEVQIRRPSGPPRVQTGEFDHHGHPVTVSCASCHATRPANPQLSRGEDLKEFHQGLAVQHGGLTCISCHNVNDYDTLRLADGRKVSYENVMTLCAQCHGPQYRDYLSGAHGGMSGHWDLSKGPRQRNNCIDCHDAHAPAFSGVIPAPPPRDRFLTPHGEHDSKGDGHE